MDYVNSTLDIGYNLLFNIIDALLQVYGFDVYCGIYHKEFYMRKSLVCDLMEPARPIVDYAVRKAINLKQFQQDDFEVINNQYVLKYKVSPKYVDVFVNDILDKKNNKNSLTFLLLLLNTYFLFVKYANRNPHIQLNMFAICSSIAFLGFNIVKVTL